MSENSFQLDADRYHQLYKLLCTAIDTNEALAASVFNFPVADAQVGEINPQVAVEAYCDALRCRLNGLLSIVDSATANAQPVIREVKA